jgi:DNA repair protein RadC
MGKIRELAEADRPREKLARLGVGGLSESELLAILLRTGVKGTSALELGRQILSQFGSLGAVSRCSVPELARIKGLGPAKAIQLAAAFGLASRLARETLIRQRMDSPELIWDLLGSEMRALQKESLRVVLLDTKYFLLRVEEISLGSLNESIAHPREIFRPAIIHAAYALIVVHNHPSGDPAPSQADHQLTRRLAEGAHLLQLRLLDHIIVGSADNGRQAWFSFREAGVL